MAVISPRASAGANPGVRIDHHDEAEHRREIAEKVNQLVTASNAEIVGVTRSGIGSGTASSHTGDTTEKALATVSITGGVLGVGGSILISSVWSFTDSANSKYIRIRFGAEGDAATHAGTAYCDLEFTQTASYSDIRKISNRTTVSAQVGMPAGLSGGVGASPDALVTSTVDTAATSEIEFSGQLETSTETITLESYRIELIEG